MATEATAAGPRIDVVVPLHNEEEAVPDLLVALERMRSLLAMRGGEAHFLLVDDGSTDGTPELLAAARKERPFLTVVTLPRRGGVGMAMREGFRRCTAPSVLCYDADCTYPVEDAVRLWEGLASADVVTATPGTGRGDVSAWRAFLTRSAAVAYRLALGKGGRGISTFTCAFRAYRRDVLLGCLPRTSGFAGTAEILVRALAAGHRVTEVASVLRERTRGRSKMRLLPAIRGHLGVLGTALAVRLGAARRGTR